MTAHDSPPFRALSASTALDARRVDGLRELHVPPHPIAASADVERGGIGGAAAPATLTLRQGSRDPGAAHHMPHAAVLSWTRASSGIPGRPAMTIEMNPGGRRLRVRGMSANARSLAPADPPYHHRPPSFGVARIGLAIYFAPRMGCRVAAFRLFKAFHRWWKGEIP